MNRTREMQRTCLTWMCVLCATASTRGVEETKDATARESLRWQELCHSLLASNEFLWRI